MNRDISSNLDKEILPDHDKHAAGADLHHPRDSALLRPQHPQVHGGDARGQQGQRHYRPPRLHGGLAHQVETSFTPIKIIKQRL